MLKKKWKYILKNKIYERKYRNKLTKLKIFKIYLQFSRVSIKIKKKKIKNKWKKNYLVVSKIVNK